MKIITKFNQYLLEKVGHPDLITPYAEMVLEKCMETVETYLSKKGFYNYSDTIEFNWDDIKKIVSKEDFLKFPVEHIILKFKITVQKFDKPQRTGWYLPISEYDVDDVSSLVMVSNTGWIDESILLEMGLELIIPYYAKSYSIDTAKKYLDSTAHHELTHAYNDYKQGEEEYMTFYEAIQLTNDDFLKLKIHPVTRKEGRGYSLYPLVEDFFNLLYIYTPVETKANIGQTFAKGETSEWEINKLKSFDAEKEYNKVIDTILDNGDEKFKETIMKYLDGIGDRLVKHYLEKCEEEDVEPIRGVIKLKNKNFKELMKYFEKRFHQRAEYMKRKIDKLKYIHREDK